MYRKKGGMDNIHERQSPTMEKLLNINSQRYKVRVSVEVVGVYYYRLGLSQRHEEKFEEYLLVGEHSGASRHFFPEKYCISFLDRRVRESSTTSK